MKAKEFINEIKKGQKDSNGFTRCWPGKHAVGTKKGKNGGQVRNCKPNEDMEEDMSRRGFLRGAGALAVSSALAGGARADNQTDPNKLIAIVNINGESKEFNLTGRFKGDPKSQLHQAEDFITEFLEQRNINFSNLELRYQGAVLRTQNTGSVREEQGVAEGLTPDQMFDIIEEMVEQVAAEHGVDPEQIWEDFESVDDHELLDESAAWHRKAGKSKTGGLNDKGIASYRREHPGSKLQKAVTTKPSKLKPGSKAAKRRKSFCARMGGVDGPMKKPNGKPTRKALALRKWNC